MKKYPNCLFMNELRCGWLLTCSCWLLFVRDSIYCLWNTSMHGNHPMIFILEKSLDYLTFIDGYFQQGSSLQRSCDYEWVYCLCFTAVRIAQGKYCCSVGFICQYFPNKIRERNETVNLSYALYALYDFFLSTFFRWIRSTRFKWLIPCIEHWRWATRNAINVCREICRSSAIIHRVCGPKRSWQT